MTTNLTIESKNYADSGISLEQLLTEKTLTDGAPITQQGDVNDHRLALLGRELKRLIKAEATA
jgi:hypothetical protein